MLMVVPVSLRPDRREQVLTRRGWVHYTETREYQRQQREEQALKRYWDDQYRQHLERERKQRVAAGMAMIFGDHDG